MKRVLPVAAFIVGALLSRGCGRGVQPESAVQCDTVVIRDTIRLPVPKPEVITLIRYDTVRPQAKPVEGVTTDLTAVTLPEDTIMRITPENDVIIPITRNIYKTDDYMAVVEGYKPRLASIELYPKTTIVTITNTRSPRWVLTVGPGIGYGPNGVQPYIGVTAGFILWSK